MAPRRWQHEIFAGEADRRRAISYINCQGDRGFSDLAYRCGQPLTNIDPIVFAVTQSFNAYLLAFGFNSLRRSVVDRDERGVVLARLDKLFGELNAGSRSRTIGLDRISNHAKSLA